MMIKKAAVLGAGTMGRGIAQLFAAYGLEVRLYDVKEDMLAIAQKEIRSCLELMASEADGNGDTIETGGTELYITETEQRISYGTELAIAVRDADLVLEAAPEQIDLKRILYRDLEGLIGPSTIVASNTSTYPLRELAEGLAYAERMLILHFFNPAVHVPLVEVVKPASLSDDSLAPVLELLRGCGKVPVILKRDVPGFIANRLQAAILREAAFLLASGVAEARDIDAAVKHGPGLRWALQGPFETADFGGLDVWEKVSGQLFPELDASRIAPELITRLVREGRLGVKNGGGIYPYADSADTEHLLEERDRQLLRVLRARTYSRDGGTHV